MSLILAIEPDRKQTSRITALAKNTLDAELVAADTTERAVAALGGRIPDLILTSLLLSPKDETALADWLRDLDDAGAHVQTLVIPVLGAAQWRSRTNGGLLTRLTGKNSKDAPTDGCDPAVFAAQIGEYLERVAEERSAAALALEDELGSMVEPTPVVPPVVPIAAPAPIAEPEPVLPSVEPVSFEPPVLPSIEPISFDPPVLRIVEREPDPIDTPFEEPVDAPFEENDAVPLELAADASAAGDGSWSDITLAQDDSDASLELTSEPIDLERFVQELTGAGGKADSTTSADPGRIVWDVPEEPIPQRPSRIRVKKERAYVSSGTPDIIVADFVDALEVMAATDADTAVEDEPPRIGAHSTADSDLWMPLSCSTAWPQLEGGVAKAVAISATTPAESPAAAERGQRKKTFAHPVQDEWGLFDPEQCGFAALLAKLDEISSQEQTTRNKR